MPATRKNVLVTGSGGLIGGVVIRTLGDKYAFTGLDRAQPTGAPDIPTTVADVVTLPPSVRHSMAWTRWCI